MRRTACILGLALAATAAGCNRSKDDALQTDLNLAAQQQAARTDSISALERGNTTPAAARSPAATARTPASPARTSSARTASSAGTSSGTSGTATGSRPASTTTVQKNTKRDAAIGAGAGAIIGATTSKNKVKGGIIGAAAGGIIGAVIGNNVDVKKKKSP